MTEAQLTALATRALVGLGLAILNPELDIEIPAGGFVSTGADVFRFAEAMRQGGAWNGKRLLSKPMVELATSNHTDTLFRISLSTPAIS